MIKPKKKVELPPTFEIAQLIALQLGVGFVALFYVLKSQEVTEIFKGTKESNLLPTVLQILKVVNALFGFACIVISGGKLITFYNELRSFIDAKKKEDKNG